ncbi:MAG: hypothetical protein RH948_18115 [Cyclobacteriaceae bacterium]
MNWLSIGLPLAAIYVIWFVFILFKKKFDKPLLIVGLSHIPYLLVNLVAPFRGLFDKAYAGYNFGWLKLEGLSVTIVIGFIVIGCLIIASKAILNQMEKLWEFTFVFDLGLSILMAFPVLMDVLIDPKGSTIQLGQYLTISGFVVATILFVLFSGPTFISTWISWKKVYSKHFKKLSTAKS